MTSKWYQNSVAQNYQRNDRYRNWEKKTEEERIANVMFPHLSTKEDQATMKEIARSESRKAPQEQKLLSDSERGGVSKLDGRMKWK
jgi:hypothetical protein